MQSFMSFQAFIKERAAQIDLRRPFFMREGKGRKRPDPYGYSRNQEDKET